ncbi:MAG: phosphohydrolase, partial [Saprospiraceae bacterium]|nr:phosphohydrolase [Saprospiraceae bacterium]
STLFEELKTYRVLQREEDWNRLQVSFLEKHTFFTPTNQRRRAPRKQTYLEQLKEVVARYDL